MTAKVRLRRACRHESPLRAASRVKAGRDRGLTFLCGGKIRCSHARCSGRAGYLELLLPDPVSARLRVIDRSVPTSPSINPGEITMSNITLKRNPGLVPFVGRI